MLRITTVAIVLVACIARLESRAAESAPVTDAQTVATLEKLGAELAFYDDKEKKLNPTFINLAQLDKKAFKEALPLLEKLHGVEQLWLTEQEVTDADLARLKGLKNLRVLEINVIPGITGEGLGHLKDLPRLENLNLMGSGITEGGFANIRALVHLRNLKVSGPAITDASLAHLTALKSLQYLELGQIEGTGKGLAGITSLKTLDASNTKKFGDEGLAAIAGCEELESLDLFKTAVTDAGLKHLIGMKNLKSLKLTGTAVSKKAVDELKQSLPKCDVEWK